jgi:hypothetical protein
MSEEKKHRQRLVSNLARLKAEVEGLPRYKGKVPLANQIQSSIDFVTHHTCELKLIQRIHDERVADVVEFKRALEEHEQAQADAKA